MTTMIIEIVKRNELHKFLGLPKRGIVERTFAWISRNRRRVHNFERIHLPVAVAASGARGPKPSHRTTAGYRANA